MNTKQHSTCEQSSRRLFKSGTLKNKKNVFLSLLLAGLGVFVLSAPAIAGIVEKDVPGAIDTSARYIFYMHGYALEQGGTRATSYDYSGILNELAKRGFVVIGEERGRVKNEEYARKITAQVKRLRVAGVPAKNITVAGHSKGGMITMLVMTMLPNPDIAYVNFAGCGKEGSGFEGYLQFAENRASMARGKLLSAFDSSDQIAGSCKLALDMMTNAAVTERVLNIGGGHELFYTPRAEWLDILQAWAERR